MSPPACLPSSLLPNASRYLLALRLASVLVLALMQQRESTRPQATELKRLQGERASEASQVAAIETESAELFAVNQQLNKQQVGPPLIARVTDGVVLH